MKFYILPEKVSLVEKKIHLMTKHMVNKPVVTFSEPMLKTYTQVEIGHDGVHAHAVIGRRRWKISVVEVVIEGLEVEGWRLVAEVFYQEGIVTLVDGKLFKNIPSQFGLGYRKCDYCGKTHSNRKESFIIYNTTTGEWKQIGTACFSKMFEQAKYLGAFMQKLGSVLDLGCGCTEEDFEGGSWGRVPNHSLSEAIDIRDMLAVVCEHRAKVCSEWKRSEYDEVRRCKRGTMYDIQNTLADMRRVGIVRDEDYFAKVGAFVKTLEEGEFNNKIKAVFEDGYVAVAQSCFVFFAQKMYEDNLKFGGSFEDYLKRLGVEVGQKVAVLGRAKYNGFEDGFYGRTYYYWITDEKTGVVFVKGFSDRETLLKYSDNGKEDGVIKFGAVVGDIQVRSKTVKLSGRLSKIK